MSLRRSRKAQDGAKAATLVAIIGGLILIYILFIPPSQREELLNTTEDGSSDDGNGNSVSNETLLLEHPGLLEYASATEYEKSIPPLTLLVSTDAVTLKTAEAITVKNSWFARESYNLTFSVGDISNTQNLLFSFNIDEQEGPLILEFNGEKIYEKEPESQNIAISLPSDSLRGKNSIIIKPASVGFSFWKTNKYSISNMKIVADVTDISGRKSQSSFIISTIENNNLENARLRFYVDCNNVADLGKLNVEINNHEVYSKIPICKEIVSQPISPNILVSGENIIMFETEFKEPTSSYYLIDNILVRLELQEPLPLTYYFDINSSQYKAVKNDSADLMMEMLFTDSTSRKKADLYINGIKTGLETRSHNYTRKLNSYAKQGNNAIKIDPMSTFEVVDLIVKIE